MLLCRRIVGSRDTKDALFLNDALITRLSEIYICHFYESYVFSFCQFERTQFKTVVKFSDRDNFPGKMEVGAGIILQNLSHGKLPCLRAGQRNLVYLPGGDTHRVLIRRITPPQRLDESGGWLPSPNHVLLPLLLLNFQGKP